MHEPTEMYSRKHTVKVLYVTDETSLVIYDDYWFTKTSALNHAKSAIKRHKASLRDSRVSVNPTVRRFR